LTDGTLGKNLNRPIVQTRADLIKDGLTVLLTQFLDNGGIESILLCFPLNIVQLADQGQHRLDDHAAPGKGH
jgi:hypothetical protein